MTITNINRRKLLQGIAGGAGFSGIGALGAIGTVGAGDAPVPLDMDELDGSEAARVLAKMRRTDEFSELQAAVRELGTNVRFTRDSATVVHATQYDVSGEAVGAVYAAHAPLIGYEDAHLTISLDADTGAVDKAGLEYPNGDSIKLVSATVDGLTSTTVTPPTEAEIQALQPPNTEGFAPMSFDPVCAYCQWAVSGVCFIGCGAPIWFICAALGIKTASLGGMACGVFIIAVCGIITVYGCEYHDISYLACEHAGLCPWRSDDDIPCDPNDPIC